MARTSIQYDGVYCFKISGSLVNYMRFYKNGSAIERPMGPLEDSKFTEREFGFILAKELVDMAGFARRGFGIGNADMILNGKYSIQKNKSIHIKVKDALGKNSEYVGTPSEDGNELILVPLILLGNQVKNNRQFKYEFKKFNGK